MHILILGGSPDHPGGVEAFCERAMQALATRNSWRMTHLATSTAYLSLRRLPRFCRGLMGLVRYRRLRPDCVWLQYVNLPDLAYLLLARMLGLRVMVTPHLGSNWRSQSNPVLRGISTWALGRAGRIALISKTQESEIQLPAHVPRSSIRNFLSANLLSAPLPTQAPGSTELQLIHSGRLSEGKGTFLFVDVCAKLKVAGVPFRARITGGADQATRMRLRSMIDAANLNEQVAVLGRVTDDELLRLLGASDILLHLSRIDSYPLIVLEAMTCATLPICMELAGARDMIETYDGAVVSGANAVNETAAFLVSVDLADIRHRGRIEALHVRQDYNWERCAGALEAALQACCSDDMKTTTYPCES